MRWLQHSGALGGAFAVALLVLSATALVGCLTWITSKSVWEYGLAVFFSGNWHPEEASFNMLPLLICSLVASVSATALAVTLGTCAALALALDEGHLGARHAEAILSVWAGVPSVILGLVVLVAASPVLGFTLVSAILAMAAMVLPGFTLTLAAILRLAIGGRYETMQALGFTLMHSLLYGLWPDVRRLSMGLAVLTLARAMGEATAVSLVAGGLIRQLPPGLFDPIETLPTAILKGYPVADATHAAALGIASCVTLVVIVALAVLAHRLRFTKTEVET